MNNMRYNGEVFNGSRLKSMRLKARMTQQDLAIKARISVGTVSRLETGTAADPRFGTVRRVAHALRVTEEELDTDGRQ